MKFKNLELYKNKKVLVTGSTGFKGGWLCLWLKLLGANVIGVGLKPEKDSIIYESLNLKEIIKQYYFDLRNFKKIDALVKREKPDIIFHLAAQSIVSESVQNPFETFDINIKSSMNILETYKKNHIKNLVYITSDKCYKNHEWIWSYRENDVIFGDDPYSASKSCAEIIFHSYFNNYFKNKKFIKMVSARAGNVIGGGDLKKNRIIPDIVKSLKRNKNIILRNPKSTRPWQNVLDPIYGYLLLGNKIMNNDLTNLISPSWNFGPDPENCKSVKIVADKVLKKWKTTKSKIVINKKNQFKEAGLLMLNNEKAKTELLWFPKLSLNQSIEWTVDWYKNYYNNANMQEFSLKQILNYHEL